MCIKLLLFTLVFYRLFLKCKTLVCHDRCGILGNSVVTSCYIKPESLGSLMFNTSCEPSNSTAQCVFIQFTYKNLYPKKGEYPKMSLKYSFYSHNFQIPFPNASSDKTQALIALTKTGPDSFKSTISQINNQAIIITDSYNILNNFQIPVNQIFGLCVAFSIQSYNSLALELESVENRKIYAFAFVGYQTDYNSSLNCSTKIQTLLGNSSTNSYKICDTGHRILRTICIIFFVIPFALFLKVLHDKYKTVKLMLTLEKTSGGNTSYCMGNRQCRNGWYVCCPIISDENSSSSHQCRQQWCICCPTIAPANLSDQNSSNGQKSSWEICKNSDLRENTVFWAPETSTKLCIDDIDKYYIIPKTWSLLAEWLFQCLISLFLFAMAPWSLLGKFLFETECINEDLESVPMSLIIIGVGFVSYALFAACCAPPCAFVLESPKENNHALHCCVRYIFHLTNQIVGGIRIGFPIMLSALLLTWIALIQIQVSRVCLCDPGRVGTNWNLQEWVDALCDNVISIVILTWLFVTILTILLVLCWQYNILSQWLHCDDRQLYQSAFLRVKKKRETLNEKRTISGRTLLLTLKDIINNHQEKISKKYGNEIPKQLQGSDSNQLHILLKKCINVDSDFEEWLNTIATETNASPQDFTVVVPERMHFPLPTNESHNKFYVGKDSKTMCQTICRYFRVGCRYVTCNRYQLKESSDEWLALGVKPGLEILGVLPNSKDGVQYDWKEPSNEWLPHSVEPGSKTLVASLLNSKCGARRGLNESFTQTQTLAAIKFSETDCKLEDCKQEKCKRRDFKRLKRSVEKVFYNYNGNFMNLRDILRATLVYHNIHNLIDAFEWIASDCKRSQEDGQPKKKEIIRIKNRIDPDTSESSDVDTGGYRDIQLLILFDGLIVELQLNLKQIFDNKHRSHLVYGLRRFLLPDGEETKLKTILDWFKSFF